MMNRWRLPAAVCVLVIGAYAYMAQSPPWEPMLDASETYYNLLVQGFRAGQLNLKKEVPARFRQLADPYDPAANALYRDPPYRMHDLSYCNGRLFLYFGVTPAVVLFWPFVALTGGHLFHRQAVVIFCALGFLASVGLLRGLWRRYFAEVNLGVVAACALALGLATGAPTLLSWAGVYEVPISSGYTFTMLALAATWCAVHEPRNRSRWLAAASVAYGLAVGSRPTLLFGAVILLVPLIQSWQERRKTGVQLLAATVPIGLIGLGLMIYNDRRFGSPFEFGLRYQLSGPGQFTQQFFSLRYLWFNFRVYFLEPARWTSRFPFVHEIVVPPLPSGYTQAGSIFGILTNIPLVWLALAAPLAWRNRPAEAASILRWFVMAAALVFGVCAMTLGLFCGANFRYEMDFLPALLLLAVVGILGLERALADRPPVWRWAVRGGWGVLLVVSVAFNLLASVTHYAAGRNWRGTLLFQKGKVSEAIGQYQRALRLQPDYAEGHYNLGVALFVAGNISEAVPQYEQAIRTRPDYTEAHNKLGVALIRLGRVPEAIRQFEEAIRIKPDFAEAHHNLATALAQTGRLQEAISQYQQVLRLQPDRADAHFGLGMVLGLAGKSTEAIVQLDEALRIRPGDPATQINLAWLLATHPPSDGGDPVRAVTLAERAGALTGNNAYPYLDTLAASYAAAGQFNDAVATAQKALAVARAANQPQAAQGIATRLELYRTGHAYHQSVGATRTQNQ